jgi:hypothetical protein
MAVDVKEGQVALIQECFDRPLDLGDKLTLFGHYHA